MTAPDEGDEREIFEAAAEPEPQPEPQPQPQAAAQPEPEQQQVETHTLSLDQLPRQDHQPDQPRHVPLAEVIEERRKRQELEARLAERDQAFAKTQGELDALRPLLNRLPQPQPVQPQEPPDLYTNPQAYIEQLLTPYIQRNEARQNILAKQAASGLYGQQEVDAAVSAFDQMAATRQIDPGTYQRVMGDMNPFAAAVEWHKQHRVQQEVGTDPEAWFQKRLESEKQKLRDEIVNELRGQAITNGTGQGTAPVVRLPSVNRAPGSPGTQPSGPVTEEDIFNAAPRRMGRRD